MEQIIVETSILGGRGGDNDLQFLGACQMLRDTKRGSMEFDFVKEYSGKSDSDLILLFNDRKNLVATAREALQVELAKRGLNEASLQADAPVAETRLSHEDANSIVVNSKQLKFPQICPRCLAASDKAIIRISPGQDFWGVRFPIVALWRYLFSRYRVPFCSRCARSIHLRRWTIRLGVIAIALGCLALSSAAGISGIAATFLLLTGLGTGWGVWKLLRVDRRWPGEGVEITSRPNDAFVRLLFKQSRYQEEFTKLNQ